MTEPTKVLTNEIVMTVLGGGVSHRAFRNPAGDLLQITVCNGVAMTTRMFMSMLTCAITGMPFACSYWTPNEEEFETIWDNYGVPAHIAQAEGLEVSRVRTFETVQDYFRTSIPGSNKTVEQLADFIGRVCSGVNIAMEDAEAVTEWPEGISSSRLNTGCA